MKKIIEFLEVPINTPNTKEWGHSGSGAIRLPAYNYQLKAIVQHKLKEKIELETGLSYSNINKKIRFNYYDDFNNIQVDDTLIMRLKYLQIPIKINFLSKLYKNNQLIFSLGIAPQYLLKYNDNYRNIIFEEIKLYGNWYRKITLEIPLAIGFRRNINPKSNIDFLVFNSINSKFVNDKRSWGFYHDLSTSFFNNLGISLNYLYNF